MKLWGKAFGIACIAELLLAVVIAALDVTKFRAINQGILSALGLYHILAVSLASTVLNFVWMWHGVASQPLRTPLALHYFLVFVFQVILTTPIVYGLLKLVD